MLSVVTLHETLRADVIFAWNEVMVQFSAVPSQAPAPHLEARAYAIAHLAMDEAIGAVAQGARSPEERTAAERSAVVGAASGLLFAVMAARGMHSAADLALLRSVGGIWATTPDVAIVIALALCIVCRLPGTSVTARRSLT